MLFELTSIPVRAVTGRYLELREELASGQTEDGRGFSVYLAANGGAITVELEGCEARGRVAMRDLVTAIVWGLETTGGKPPEEQKTDG